MLRQKCEQWGAAINADEVLLDCPLLTSCCVARFLTGHDHFHTNGIEYVKKSKGERERYTQLNTEFHRIARKDKKGFFNEQCKKIEGNNRRGKTRGLFKKIGNIKGIFHPKMGTIKYSNSIDLKKQRRARRNGKTTQKNVQKNILMTQITTVVWSLRQSQRFWSVKSRGPLEALLLIKLVVVMEF